MCTSMTLQGILTSDCLSLHTSIPPTISRQNKLFFMCLCMKVLHHSGSSFLQASCDAISYQFPSSRARSMKPTWNPHPDRPSRWARKGDGRREKWRDCWRRSEGWVTDSSVNECRKKSPHFPPTATCFNPFN